MKAITVSGAYRNIGKTTLVRRIRTILGEKTVALKIGHGSPKKKPEIFTDNIHDALQKVENIKKSGSFDFIIIESNGILSHLNSDLSIFIDGEKKPPKESARAARDLADIVISKNIDMKIVGQKLHEAKIFTDNQRAQIEKAIQKTHCDTLINDLNVRTKIWLEKDGKMVFGYGKFILLQKVVELESLNKAAKELKMSYRHAWAYIKAMEERLGYKILEAKIPGNKNSGSKLTEMAERLVYKYQSLIEEIESHIDQKSSSGLTDKKP